MMARIKNNLWKVFVPVFIVVMAIMFLTNDLEHIEDTNGADDCSLTTITDQQIIDNDMGALGFRRQKEWLSDMVTFSSDEFTGVYEVCYNDYLTSADIEFTVYDFAVSSGNFKMCVVNEGKIIAVIEPQEEPISYSVENVKGEISLVIAGESAEFTFRMTEYDYDLFGHDDWS